MNSTATYLADATVLLGLFGAFMTSLLVSEWVATRHERIENWLRRWLS